MCRKNGFTFIELLITIAIIGIIAAIILPLWVEKNHQKILFGQTFENLTLPPSYQQRAILQPLVTERLHLTCRMRAEDDSMTNGQTTDPAKIQQRLDRLEGKGLDNLPCDKLRKTAQIYGFSIQ